jgi:5'-nucleotidase / UDP-sugar diphosphatase
MIACRLLLASCFVLCAGAASGQGADATGAGEQGLTLHILHTNDTHSRVEPINNYGATCSTEEAAEDACLGGAARVHTAIREKREALEASGAHVLVLDAGDRFQGSLFFTTYSGEAEVEMMNRAGFDAMVVGNHEFDLGPGPLASFIQAAKFPVLLGNAEAAAGDQLAPLDRGSVVIEVGGEKIGVVGAVTAETAETSMPGPAVTFNDPIEHLKTEVAALAAEGVTHVIALTHVGAPDDIEIAEQVPGLDAIVGGHSHTLFSNTDESAAFSYPYEVEGPDGRPVPIVQAGAYTQYLGHLVLTFDAEGNVIEASGDTVLLDASIEPDKDVAARIEQLKAPIEDLMTEVVASVAAPVEAESCRAAECAMGNLVADAMLGHVADQGIDMAIQNGGGLRASLAAGEVTMGDVVAVLPFQNTLATFELTGENILAALETGVSKVEEGGGRFPQVAGLRFSWDPKAASGERIQAVEVRKGEAWAPLDRAATYGVVANNFLRGGGDGYTIFRDAAINPYDFGPNLEAVLVEYLAERPDYMPYTDQRIVRVE